MHAAVEPMHNDEGLVWRFKIHGRGDKQGVCPLAAGRVPRARGWSRRCTPELSSCWCGGGRQSWRGPWRAGRVWRVHGSADLVAVDRSGSRGSHATSCILCCNHNRRGYVWQISFRLPYQVAAVDEINSIESLLRMPRGNEIGFCLSDTDKIQAHRRSVSVSRADRDQAQISLRVPSYASHDSCHHLD